MTDPDDEERVLEASTPMIPLIHGARTRVRVFAQLVEPQPANLPPGLVLIVLPWNCYIDPSAEALDDAAESAEC